MYQIPENPRDKAIRLLRESLSELLSAHDSYIDLRKEVEGILENDKISDKVKNVSDSVLNMILSALYSYTKLTVDSLNRAIMIIEDKDGKYIDAIRSVMDEPKASDIQETT